MTKQITMKLLILVLSLANAFSQNAKIGILEQDIRSSDGSETENEFITVELKKPGEDIKFVAKVRFHMENEQIHVNNYPLQHNVVNSVRMMVLVTDIVNGKENNPQKKSVDLRVLVEERNLKGVKRLLVEEEFVAIGEEDVEQIEVKQLIWESNVRLSVLSIKLIESRIHKKPRNDDHRMFIPDKGMTPNLPNEGQKSVEHHRCYHHTNSSYMQKHYGNAKCWYHHLNAKAKIGLFSLGFFGLLTAVLFCCLCAKRRQHHRALNVSVPMDDTVIVDVDTKKSDGKEGEFHFEFDQTVAIDDRKALVEEA